MRLREKGCGIYDERPYSEFLKGLEELEMDVRKKTPKDGESWEHMNERVTNFYEEIIDIH